MSAVGAKCVVSPCVATAAPMLRERKAGRGLRRSSGRLCLMQGAQRSRPAPPVGVRKSGPLVALEARGTRTCAERQLISVLLGATPIGEAADSGSRRVLAVSDPCAPTSVAVSDMGWRAMTLREEVQ